MRRILLLVAALMVLAVTADAAVVSTFDTGQDGWLVADFDPNYHQPSVTLLPTAIWESSAGLAGGGLRVGDITYWTHVAAPSQYLGDWRGWPDGAVEFDLLIRYTDGVPYSAVAVRGLGKTLLYVRPTPPLNVWTHISAPLAASGWVVNGYTGKPAGPLDFWEVLRSVEGLYLMSEWRTGPDDTQLDTVALSLDPRRPDGIHVLAREVAYQATKDGSKHFRFTFTGRVSAYGPSGFDLDDQSGAIIHVAADGVVGIADGDVVSATGVLNAAATPPTLKSSHLDIVKR